MGKIKKIHQVTNEKFLNFYTLDTIKKTGEPGRYFLSSRAPSVEELEIVRKETKADGVAMYVICGEKKDKVLLIRQFRWPIGNYVYEFPAGLVDEGESLREAAVREVWEETGLKMTPLDVDYMYERPYYMTDGMTDEACAMVYGYAPDEIKKQHLEDSEEIEVIIADREEVRRILREERVAGNAAHELMHFLSDEDPFAFLKGSDACTH
jgi:ADP-ribose pyrophosphatase